METKHICLLLLLLTVLLVFNRKCCNCDNDFDNIEKFRGGGRGGFSSSSRSSYNSATTSNPIVNLNIPSFYQHCDYKGSFVNLDVGDYYLNIGNNKRKFTNDYISSVKVPSGYKVTLYEHDEYKGTSLVLTQDNPCLVKNNFNDKTSSIKVEKI